MSRTASILIAAFIAATNLPGEAIRVAVEGSLIVSDSLPEGTKATLGFSGAVGISVEPSPFIDAIELELRIPQEATSIRGAFLWSIHKACSPAPDSGTVSYKGTEVTTKELPQRLSLVVQIPLKKNHGLKAGPYATILPAAVEQDEYPILFRLTPVMKGLSHEIETAKFTLKARPILADAGLVRLNVKMPDSLPQNTPYSVTVDEVPVEHPEEPLRLKTGTRRLRIFGDEIMDENRTIVVERAKTGEVTINLRDTTPILTLEGPDTAQAWIDGERLDLRETAEIFTTPGERVVTFKVGDYTVSRKINVQKGRKYRIILSVDVQIQEE